MNGLRKRKIFLGLGGVIVLVAAWVFLRPGSDKGAVVGLMEQLRRPVAIPVFEPPAFEGEPNRTVPEHVPHAEVPGIPEAPAPLLV